jgi:glycosyltransferase involved in cell wall biosynthesis
MDDTPIRPPLTMSLNSQEVELSVIVPLYEEEANLPVLYERLRAAVDALGRTYELIFINDGSTDRTGALIDALAETDDGVVAISFPRNFGQTAALLAGFDHARGRILVPMDGDLQNDPADIARLLEALDNGYDVVSGWRKQRHDPWTKVLPSRIANAVISRVSGVRLHDYGCSLKAYRREVLEGVDLYGEMHRFVPIYATWRGARVTEIPVTHHPRSGGRSKYGLERVIKVLLDLIVVKFLTSYLTKPIYIFGGFGMLNIALATLAIAAAVVFKVVPQDNPWGPGWHKDFVETPLPVAAVGLLLLGIQMILIGLLAEMLMRTYYESQGKRAYVISSIRRGRGEQAYPVRQAG